MNNILEDTDKVIFIIILQNIKDIQLFNAYYHKFCKNFQFICITPPRQSYLITKANNVHILTKKVSGAEKQLNYFNLKFRSKGILARLFLHTCRRLPEK